MPFCTKCGHETAVGDAYCGSCGARLGSAAAGPPPPQAVQDPFSGLSPHAAAILCYTPAVGWIAAVIVLATRKFRNERTVRFHAYQGLYLFAAWLVVSWVVRPLVLNLPDQFIRIDHILEALILGVSIFMMVKASHDEPYVLPIIGELAQKSATEH
jgi:uncharacterized membrane protein